MSNDEYDGTNNPKKITFFDYPSGLNEKSEFVLFGVPFNGNTTQTRGFTETAPQKIRELSLDISLTTESGLALDDELKLVDLGNLTPDNKPGKNENRGNHLNEMTPFDLEELINKQIKYVYNINPNIIPVFIGGNHYITHPCVSNIRNHYKPEDLVFVSLDAHLDFYDEWEGKHFTHCTVVKRIFDSYPQENRSNVFVLGARDIDIPEQELAESLNYTTIYQYRQAKKTSELKNQNLSFSEFSREFLRNKLSEEVKTDKKTKKKAYISIDLDVLDPSAAPATGYPIPGGISYYELLDTLEMFSQEFDIIGFDFVEYAPNLDLKNEMTGFLGAKVIIEFIMMIKTQQNTDNKKSL